MLPCSLSLICLATVETFGYIMLCTLICLVLALSSHELFATLKHEESIEHPIQCAPLLPSLVTTKWLGIR